MTKTPWHSEDELPYTDAESTLAHLFQRGYKLGIIANQKLGTSERLESWKLRQYFDIIVASAEIGYAKPDLRIFEKALELAGCTAQECVMVGDRLDNDMHPAKAVGMTTVWIKNGLAKYQNAKLGMGIADYSIERLSDLLSIFL